MSLLRSCLPRYPWSAVLRIVVGSLPRPATPWTSSPAAAPTAPAPTIACRLPRGPPQRWVARVLRTMAGSAPRPATPSISTPAAAPTAVETIACRRPRPPRPWVACLLGSRGGSLRLRPSRPLGARLLRSLGGSLGSKTRPSFLPLPSVRLPPRWHSWSLDRTTTPGFKRWSGMPWCSAHPRRIRLLVASSAAPALHTRRYLKRELLPRADF